MAVRGSGSGFGTLRFTCSTALFRLVQIVALFRIMADKWLSLPSSSSSSSTRISLRPAVLLAGELAHTNSQRYVLCALFPCLFSTRFLDHGIFCCIYRKLFQWSQHERLDWLGVLRRVFWRRPDFGVHR
jgi:hypothetical protein